MSLREKVLATYCLAAKGDEFQSWHKVKFLDFKDPKAAAKELGVTEQELGKGVDVTIKGTIYCNEPPEGSSVEFDIYYKGKRLRSALTDEKETNIQKDLLAEDDSSYDDDYETECDRRLHEWRDEGGRGPMPSTPRRRR